MNFVLFVIIGLGVGWVVCQKRGEAAGLALAKNLGVAVVGALVCGFAISILVDLFAWVSSYLAAAAGAAIAIYALPLWLNNREKSQAKDADQNTDS